MLYKFDQKHKQPKKKIHTTLVVVDLLFYELSNRKTLTSKSAMARWTSMVLILVLGAPRRINNDNTVIFPVAPTTINTQNRAMDNTLESLNTISGGRLSGVTFCQGWSPNRWSWASSGSDGSIVSFIHGNPQSFSSGCDLCRGSREIWSSIFITNKQHRSTFMASQLKTWKTPLETIGICSQFSLGTFPLLGDRERLFRPTSTLREELFRTGFHVRFFIRGIAATWSLSTLLDPAYLNCPSNKFSWWIS